jgi:hypothetical protein
VDDGRVGVQLDTLLNLLEQCIALCEPLPTLLIVVADPC